MTIFRILSIYIRLRMVHFKRATNVAINILLICFSYTHQVFFLQFNFSALGIFKVVVVLVIKKVKKGGHFKKILG